MHALVIFNINIQATSEKQVYNQVTIQIPYLACLDHLNDHVSSPSTSDNFILYIPMPQR
jgi:hypothetical protein